MGPVGQHQTNNFTLYESQKEEEKGAEHIFEEEITSLTLRRNRLPDPGSAKSSHKNKWKSVMQKSTDFFTENKAQSDASNIWQNQKPTSLNNEEFTQLVFEAFDVCFVFQLL